MFHKRQNSLIRYFASEGNITKKDILPQEEKLEETANCLAGHGRDGLKNNKCPRSTDGYGLDVAGYGWFGPEKSWTVPSLVQELESLFCNRRRSEKSDSDHLWHEPLFEHNQSSIGVW